MALTAWGSTLGFPLLLLFALLLGAASSAQAAGDMCSDYPGGVIDGNVVDISLLPSTLGIDRDCTIKNFPQSVGGLPFTLINFQFPTHASYLIVFDNVYYEGNMSCNDPTHSTFSMWWSNGSYNNISASCQEFIIPVDGIHKENPVGQTTTSVGVPFTYTLTFPDMAILTSSGYVYSGNPDTGDVYHIEITDDLTATGADLTYVSSAAYLKNSDGTTTPLGSLTNSGDSKHLSFLWADNPALATIPAGTQIVLELTVVLDDTPANAPGTQFINTAHWELGRMVNGERYEPLPGQDGITQPMTIVGPNLVVTKTSSETALNLGVLATFTIDVQNTGGSDAWNATIVDQLPDGPSGGMCDYDPTTAPGGVTVQIFEADGVTPVSGLLEPGTDYSVTYSGAPTCQLSLTMLDTPAAKVGPSQHLVITYQSQIDGDSTNGITLTNVAGATRWFSGDSSLPGRRQYDKGPLTDGTPGVLDFQDSLSVTAALSGYYFQKTVENLATGADPAITAAPGDPLRYKLRLFNIDQDINDITISDVLDPTSFDLSTFAMITPPPAGATYSFDSASGLLTISGDSTPLDVAVGGELVIEFDITLKSTLDNSTVVSNQASLSSSSLSSTEPSDDPYVNGIAMPSVHGDEDPTAVTIQSPGPLSKANIQASATIGEQFRYRITVPATPVDVPLYDVRILDDLGLSAADVRFVSADVVSGGTWALSNTGSATSLIIEDTATGIDIPAGDQAVIEITVELENTTTNQTGRLFNNSASYTYNRMNGNDATQTAGGAGTTVDMTVVEPNLTATKAVRFITPAGKLPTDPATVGDVLEYVVTIPNAGDSTAFDTSVADTLPANVSLVPGSATAQINDVDVTDFIVNPTTLPGGALAWGQQNADETLDIPPGQSLVLTYQVTVESATGTDILNSAYVDWTSLDGASAGERTGDGCPTTTAPDTYCYGPAAVTVGTLDNTSIAKSVVDDSYAETPASTTDPIVRVGDTVTYDLTLNLQEYTTGNVVVEDALPEGMALESFTINGSGDFSYTLAAQPATGDTGTLRWEFGDITNLPSKDGTPVDPLVIQYVAKVVTDAPPVGVTYDTTILRDNSAQLSYTGGDPAVYPDRLSATETIDVRQPHMMAISKVDLGSGRTGTGTPADPYQVTLATDVMNFHLSSCNDGLAPAYGVVITDQLAPELDESDMTANPPVVKIGTTTLSAGIDYTYTAPAPGGEMRIALLDSAPVNQGECVTVDYDIGFHTDLTVSKSWSNQAQLPEYRSLPLSQPGRLYASTDLAEVWMTNVVNDEQLLKTLVSPPEATIGDEVVYQIKVPAAPMNIALDNVVVTDTLHGALEYVGASAVDSGGAAVVLTDGSVAPGQVNLGIAHIPANEQVIITLTARVVNNDQANAGVSFTNTASYTYAGMPAGLDTASTSGPLTIVEPAVAIAKTVANVSNPGAAPNAGDILRYSVSFTAAGGAVGDNFSDAFDLSIFDSLSLGLAYQNGTARVNGAGNTIADPVVTGDGRTTAQTLTWSLADATADIDVVEGTVVSVTYDVLVLDGVLAGQELTNSATARWTGLDGNDAFERTGSGTPVENDYVTGPATTSLRTELAVPFVKSVVNVSTGADPGANAEPGDTLRYTLVLTNESIIPLNNVSVVDELAAQFAPGSLHVLSVSDASADTTNTDATGGANGTGIVDIRNLTLGAQGDPDDSLTIVFEATLASVIQSGTAVLNQAQMSGDYLASVTSNETSTLITSTPAFEVWKTSQDVTGDPTELMAGDTLRYTITVKNVGNENAVNVVLKDQIPANTTYVAGSTTLNGSRVADPAVGTSPLQDGLPVNAPEDTTAGAMRADATATTSNVATVTFDVVIDSDVVDGAIIANQGFVHADGAGSGPAPEEPSDDPATPVLNDPTRNVVGNVPLVDAYKTVQILVDGGSSGIVDPGDRLQYTIVISNAGAAPAEGVVFTDAIPADTTYVDGSGSLNGDTAGVTYAGSVLTADYAAQYGDLPPGSTAVVTFDVDVNAGVAARTVISNQGIVSTNELPDEPTDADGIDSNGDQPTQVVVGDAQHVSILKEVFVVGGGAAEPGSQLEYVIRVTNIGSLPATGLVVTDDLGPLAGQVSYVDGSGSLNGSTAGVTYMGSVLTADYAGLYGDLPPGAGAVVRFQVHINPAVAIGTTIKNKGVVHWNGTQSEAEVSLDVGGTPGSGTLGGRVWHDASLNKVYDGTETGLEGWSVELYRGGRLLATVLTDSTGAYRLSGLAPNEGTSETYELHFTAPGAGPNTASMGQGDSPFTNGPQRISGITVASGGSLQNLNLPLWPNGAVYNSVRRSPVAGARLAMVDAATNAPLPPRCFDDPVQQNQVTAANGFYKFDLNFSDASCPAGGTYLIEVTPPATGYMNMPSQVVAPPEDNTATTPFPVVACPGNSLYDAEPATSDYCEAMASTAVPPQEVSPDDITYYLYLQLSNGTMPGQSQIFNNSIPIDPVLDGAVAITKTTPLINVTRGTLVPYTITVTNVYGAPLHDVGILDRFPAGFKYVAGSARLNGKPAEPDQPDPTKKKKLTWNIPELQVNQKDTLQLLLVVGSGVSEGEYVNRAMVLDTATGGTISAEATATVRVIPDPTFDCTDVIGKVFDDRNLNGRQDTGEKGLPGVRAVTARGLIATSDKYGRFHITCAAVPDEDRGSNFILKVDERSLPTGYRLTTENPRVQRATRGKMLRFTFGATIHRVVRIDIADGAFEPDTTELRMQWTHRIDRLLEELKKGPSVLRLSYLADVESKGIVQERLEALKKEIIKQWKQSGGGYRLDIETEIFWRRGAPVAGQ
jgi:uncharacterized repeat protein (TIGR01451 family)/fimbrial isopeptide formation D2 family protein